MLDFTEYSKIFISLFAIVDPVGIIPIIIALTAGMTAQKRERVGRMASFSVLVILLAALLSGEAILGFFGISIHSFRTAGGILLLLMSINMLIGDKPKYAPDDISDSDTTSSVAIVPLSTPLLAGPGAISTVILDAHKGTNTGHYGRDGTHPRVVEPHRVVDFPYRPVGLATPGENRQQHRVAADGLAARRHRGGIHRRRAEGTISGVGLVADGLWMNQPSRRM
jgi:MarC family membrane protein